MLYISFPPLNSIKKSKIIIPCVTESLGVPMLITFLSALFFPSSASIELDPTWYYEW